VAIYVRNETRPKELRGSGKEEFDAREQRAKAAARTPWPTYGFDNARTHVAGDLRHRPPFGRRWTFTTADTIEFPPSIGYGRMFVAQQRGPFHALSARTGEEFWQKDFGRCAASSPTVDTERRVVFQAYMHPVQCPQDAPGADGFVVALDVNTGKELWRFRAGPVESSPLLVKGTLYFGSWDHKVYAVDARTGRERWSYETSDQVNTSAAYGDGTVFIANDAGEIYALGARSGKRRWRSGSEAQFGSREFFYATPTFAYDRVYIGNTDGTVYAYGARTGKLRWARPAGSYIYSAAAAYRKTIYVGSYDGNLYALDAATGDVRWKHSSSSAIHAAPQVMDGLVYFATCSSCGMAAKRDVKRGSNGTIALDADSGDEVWRSAQGKYASPIVADERYAFLIGRTRIVALRDRRPARER
jgi:outer membrane protein assembly factor BamB